MTRLGWALLAIALVAGAFSGSAALASAAASQPPLQWRDVMTIGAFALVGLPAVLGFQVLIGNVKAMRLGWLLFLLAGGYCVTAGLAALVVAARGPGLVPHAFLFLVLGLAMLGGVGLVRVAFRRRFVAQ